jgi:prepilin-type N-terminal cleavage/methylation domain-containing protein
MTTQTGSKLNLNEGFTLIELMISVTLGSLVIYTATAGFRVASQSMTAANRLGVENAIMRAGLQQAHDRLDFWTDCDNPEDTSEQKLRNPIDGVGKGGLPFTPMQDVFPYVPNSTNPELSTGWNPNEKWSPSDSRTWWHNSLAQNHDTNLMLGRYALFANSKPSFSIPLYHPPGATDASRDIPAYGSVKVPHSWLSNQIWGMHSALGFYGYCDYLPAGTMFGCSIYDDTGPDSGQMNADGMATFSLNGNFSFSGSWVSSTKGLWRLSTFSGYGLVNPTYPGSGNALVQREMYNVGYRTQTSDEVKNFLNKVNYATPVISSGGPASWPKAEVSVGRMIKTGRFIALCSVKMTSPFSGETVQLNFSSFSTSLRGARQQRARDFNRWAIWDNASTPIPGNDLTLDDTTPPRVVP